MYCFIGGIVSIVILVIAVIVLLLCLREQRDQGRTQSIYIEDLEQKISKCKTLYKTNCSEKRKSGANEGIKKVQKEEKWDKGTDL